VEGSKPALGGCISSNWCKTGTVMLTILTATLRGLGIFIIEVSVFKIENIKY
jgi:hypothetical protein